MAITYYDTGTISLTNGSAVVTGNGTAWEVAQIAGGVISVQAPGGNPLPIRAGEPDYPITNTQLTSVIAWTGETGTYSYAISRHDDVNQVMRNAQTLSEVVEEIRNGTIFKYDVSGSLADRNMYGAQPKGFAYLVTEGASADLYVKRSSTLNDWAGPFSYGAGPVGPAPNLIIGNVTTRPTGQPATASVSGSGGSYSVNLGLPTGASGFAGWSAVLELVPYGSSEVMRVADYIGGSGPKPSGVGKYIGSAGLVDDLDDARNVRGADGATGPRGITWRGEWVSGSVYSENDIVTDDDVGGEAATWISLTQNSSLRPRENPSDWHFFPASVPATLSDGLWGEAPTDTSNDGVWA